MIVGEPSEFAIESKITRPDVSSGIRGVGYFVIHVAGRPYGVRQDEATCLACSYDAVRRRLTSRGKHTASFSSEPDAHRIAEAFRKCFYSDSNEAIYLGLARDHFETYFRRDAGDLLWAPDGDEAFDDSSYILQFDVGYQVRLIGFQCDKLGAIVGESLRDLWLPADTYYGICLQWADAFETDWRELTGERAR